MISPIGVYTTTRSPQITSKTLSISYSQNAADPGGWPVHLVSPIDFPSVLHVHKLTPDTVTADLPPYLGRHPSVAQLLPHRTTFRYLYPGVPSMRAFSLSRPGRSFKMLGDVDRFLQKKGSRFAFDHGAHRDSEASEVQHFESLCRARPCEELHHSKEAQFRIITKKWVKTAIHDREQAQTEEWRCGRTIRNGLKNPLFQFRAQTTFPPSDPYSKFSLPSSCDATEKFARLYPELLDVGQTAELKVVGE
jgi:hypothetical protein